MKKLIAILTFLIITSFSFADDVNQVNENNKTSNKKGVTRIAFLVDMDGTFNTEDNNTLNDSFGGQILLERAYRIDEQLELGLGIGTQGNGHIQTANGLLTGFYSVPLYAEAKYNIIGGALYVKGRLGVPVVFSNKEMKCYLQDTVTNIDKNSLELSGKFFGGLAVGLDYGDFEWECGYSYNYLNYKYMENGQSSSSNLENIRVSIGFSKKL